MKKTLLSLLLTAAVCLVFTACGCASVSELGYQGCYHLEKTAGKFADKFAENQNSPNKFLDKAEEKINKDYTWIVYKLWKTE